MKFLRAIAGIAMVLALIVVILGAYTRLTDAGLGCPDWPGCYGRMVVPASAHEQILAQKQYPNTPIEARKAWTEMAHRYVAGTLALLILGINVCVWCYRRQRTPRALALFLLILIGFQAALGMWTVTFKLLPIVVMGHLLGGLLIFGGLVYLNWLLNTPRSSWSDSRWHMWVNLALVIVFAQIALGGWVSSNYAGLACIGFPQCNGHWLPTMTWQASFQWWSPIGANYQGGLLDSASRVTIQMVHRIGAVVTLCYLGLLSLGLLRQPLSTLCRRIVVLILLCVAIQCALGVGNVIYLLPLWIAVAHNGMAALLFAAVLSLHFMMRTGGAYAGNAKN